MAIALPKEFVGWDKLKKLATPMVRFILGAYYTDGIDSLTVELGDGTDDLIASGVAIDKRTPPAKDRRLPYRITSAGDDDFDLTFSWENASEEDFGEDEIRAESAFRIGGGSLARVLTNLQDLGSQEFLSAFNEVTQDFIRHQTDEDGNPLQGQRLLAYTEHVTNLAIETRKELELLLSGPEFAEFTMVDPTELSEVTIPDSLLFEVGDDENGGGEFDELETPEEEEE